MKTLRYVTMLVLLVMALFGTLAIASADGGSNATDFPPGPTVGDYPPGPSSSGIEGQDALKPDLKATFIYVGPLGGVPGYPTMRPVTVDIKNFGAATGKTFIVHYRNSKGQTMGSKWVYGLGAGQTVELSLMLWKEKCVTIVVDAMNVVSESNEANNQGYGCW